VYTVTLLTGDVVSVRTRPVGCPTVSIRPAAPGRVTSWRCDPAGHLHVVPADVAPLLRHTLDPALFDVTTLINNGYDDARSAETPLIVVGGAAARSGTATAGPGAFGLRLRGARTLASIGAVAGRQPKADSAGLRAAVPHLAATRSAAPLTAERRTSPAGPAVWLDRTIRISTGPPAPAPADAGPAATLRQVGAPQAWRAGYTGRGVRVAVLDTGVDPAHPDVAGRVAEAADFSGEGDTVDRNGHGTLVAATVAGTGVASAGRYRGVAPDARLVVGKVLGSDGHGSETDVIAGMEWAAQRADVVNMSLGGLGPSDGMDPLSQAVDHLTSEHGTLFVVSAGNLGAGDGTVTAPAAASAALTVGAVDVDDRLSPASSRGPLTGTGAIKPDLVAPGVEVVGARAAGTTMGRVIDARYTADSGTSVAAPHAAGAAAILKQRHPGWPAQRLKAALVATASPVPGDAFARGGGRLDIPRALGRAVVPTRAVVDLGRLAGPEAARPSLEWHNAGVTPLRLELTVATAARTGIAAPAGAVRLSAATVTVPPGGTAPVTLEVAPERLASRPGTYLAVVSARNGDQVSRTFVSFSLAPPEVDLTVRADPLPGTPEGALSAVAYLVDLDDPTRLIEPVTLPGPEPDGAATVRVPAGRYSVLGEVWDTTPEAGRLAIAGDPDVTVTDGAVVRLDGRRARPLEATVSDVDTTPRTTALTYVQDPRVGQAFSGGAWVQDGVPANQLFVVPGAGADIGSFAAYAYFSLDANDAPGGPRRYDLLRPLGAAFPAEPAYRLDTAEQARLARIDQRFHRLDGADGEAGFVRYALTPEGLMAGISPAEAPPERRTDFVTADTQWADEALHIGTTFTWTSVEPLSRYAPGSRHQKSWVDQPLRPDWYPATAAASNYCTPAPVRRAAGNLHVALAELVDTHGRANCLRADDGLPSAYTRRLTLHRGAELVGTADASVADFTVPRAAADYRLSYEWNVGGLLPASVRGRTVWTFRSAGPPSPAEVPVPLLSLDYALPRAGGDGTAGISVRQMPGVRPQRVTKVTAWISTDDGRTWLAAPAAAPEGGQFRFTLPAVTPGTAVSLRVQATGDGGSGIDQTIIRAYRG
jgi:subtilisin family serine protease